MLNVLNSTPIEKCPVHSAFDILIRSRILYKNALGTAFLLHIAHIILIDSDNQKTISDWLSTISSFDTEFASDIAKYKTVWQRDKDEAYGIFKKLADDIELKFAKKEIPVELIAVSESFRIDHLSSKEMKFLESKIYHGTPVGRLSKPEENSINKEQ